MRKIVLTFGLIAGAVMSAMMLLTMAVSEQIRLDHGEVIGYATMVLAFLMVFFGVRTYRDQVAGGRVTFGRAFKVGLFITLIATVCYVATWELVYYQFMPDFGKKYAAHMLERARESGATEAEMAAKTRQMEHFQEIYRNPLINIAFTFLEPLPVGLLFALVTAGVLSRRRTEGLAATPG